MSHRQLQLVEAEVAPAGGRSAGTAIPRMIRPARGNGVGFGALNPVRKLSMALRSESPEKGRCSVRGFGARLSKGVGWRSRAIKTELGNTWTQCRWALAGKGLALRDNDRRLANLRNCESGRRLFILGNGPSLNLTDVDRLCDEVSIASNSIFLLFGKKRYRPAYYTIEDCLVAEDRHVEAAGLKNCWKLFPEDVRAFIPSDERTIYVNFVRGDYRGFPRFTDNFCRRVYWGGTVTFMNLQLARYLGASRIYLIGFDHNYALPTDRDAVQGTVITSATADVNHFDPRYFGAGYRWHDPNVRRMEEAYRVAGVHLVGQGVQVFNATRGGQLEVFPRVDFDSLFE